MCNWKTSLQNGKACVSWGYQLLCRSSCTFCKWKAFFLNVCLEVTSLCAGVLSYLLVCSWKVSLLNGLACVSWGYQLLCKRSCTVCKQKNSSLYEPACDFSDEKHWRFSSRTGCNCGALFRHAESYVSWCLCSSWRRGCTDHMSKVCLESAFPWFVYSSAYV